MRRRRARHGSSRAARVHAHRTQKWLIVGLGNPGRTYARTRHNLGTRVIDGLRRELKLPTLTTRTALHARTLSTVSLVMAVPTTYMNDSGRAVGALLKDTCLCPAQLVVVHDDKDLAFGTVKMQKNRSAAGHRGVASVMDALGTQDFWRLRIGIGPPPFGTPMQDYVVQRFTTGEEQAWTTTGLQKSLALLRTHIDTNTHRIYDTV